ncbi:MAG: uroporphyrinogen decarboxylase family protein [Planctomycetota bacterium]
MREHLDNDLILRAMRGEHTERTPVWLMRQAGRFDPAYRTLRQQAGVELEVLFMDPERAAQITLLPVRFGVDAAILFQDILTPLGPMGAPFVFRPGPTLERAVTSDVDADRLELYDPIEKLGFVYESIELALERLAGRMPLLGFAGAPMTLLNFLVCGGSPGGCSCKLERFLSRHEAAADRLLQRLAGLVAAYVRGQIEAGVHAVQIFESSAADVEPELYRRFALPYQRMVFDSLDALPVPTILFAKGVCPALMAESGAGVLSIGSGLSIADARKMVPGHPLQGNIDNMLLRHGTPSQVRRAAEECITLGGHRGHVLNLGHGVIKDTPVENVEAMIGAAHSCMIEQGAAA